MQKKTLYFLLILLVISPLSFADDTKTVVGTDSTSSSTTQTPNDFTPPVKSEVPKAWQDLTFSDYLGVTESFNLEKPQIEKTVESYSDINSIESSFDELQNLLKESRIEWQDRIKLSSWDLNSVLKFNTAMSGIFEMSKQEKEEYFEFVNKTESLVSELKDKKGIFDNFYRKAKLDPTLQTQASLMKESVDSINSLLIDIQKLQIKYAKIYNSKSEIIDSLELFSNQIDGEINYLSEIRFNKSHAAFYEEEFRNFFNTSTWQNLLAAKDRIINYSFENLKNNFFDFFKLAVLFLTLGIVLRRLKKSDRVRPVFLKPFTLAFLMSLIGFRAWSETFTVFGDLVFWILVVLCVQLLLNTFARQATDRRGLRWLVFVYGVLQVVNTVGIPQILYRVLLVLLPITLAIYGYIEVTIDKEEKRNTFLYMMKALVALCISASLAEIMGYHPLAVLLFQGALQSVFAIFIAWQLRYVFFKIIFSTFTFLADRGFQFFDNFKTLLLRKVRFLTDVFGSLILLSLLLSIWGFHGTWWQSVLSVWDFGFSFQDFHLTLGRVLQSYYILYFTHFLSYLATNYLDEVVYPHKGVPLGSAKAINTLINYFAWVIGLFGAFSALGFALEQFAIIAGALSVGIGFGLQNIVNNFVSGLILLFERPIKVGDIVRINGEVGDVEKVGLRSTVIRTAAKTQKIVPNSDLITQQVENLTLTDNEYRILIPIGVAYGSETQLVKNTLLNVATSFDMILKHPMPQVFFVGFGESSLDFELWAWIPDVNFRRALTSDMNFKIDEEFRKANIEIPFPQRDIHIRSGKNV